MSPLATAVCGDRERRTKGIHFGSYNRVDIFLQTVQQAVLGILLLNKDSLAPDETFG